MLFILIHLKTLSTVNKINLLFVKWMGREAEQAAELEQLVGSLAQDTQGCVHEWGQMLTVLLR